MFIWICKLQKLLLLENRLKILMKIKSMGVVWLISSLFSQNQIQFCGMSIRPLRLLQTAAPSNQEQDRWAWEYCTGSERTTSFQFRHSLFCFCSWNKRNRLFNTSPLIIPQKFSFPYKPSSYFHPTKFKFFNHFLINNIFWLYSKPTNTLKPSFFFQSQNVYKTKGICKYW